MIEIQPWEWVLVVGLLSLVLKVPFPSQQMSQLYSRPLLACLAGTLCSIPVCTTEQP
jgi:hypothetical protein